MLKHIFLLALVCKREIMLLAANNETEIYDSYIFRSFHHNRNDLLKENVSEEERNMPWNLTNKNLAEISNKSNKEVIYNDYEFDKSNIDGTRIIGGVPIAIDKIPSYVVIFQKTRQICTGNLISIKNVLTAAHCVTTIYTKPSKDMFYEIVPESTISVRIGSTMSDKGGTLNYAWKINVHPNFLKHQEIVLFRDIAVITLWYQVALSETVNIANIHPTIDLKSFNELKGSKCTVAGWGSTKFDGQLSTHLQTISITIISHVVCRVFFGSLVNPICQICTKDPNKDSCQGDSGAGVFCNGSLLAITSWGRKCDDGFPAVYARVDNVREFIDKTVNRADTYSQQFYFSSSCVFFFVKTLKLF